MKNNPPEQSTLISYSSVYSYIEKLCKSSYFYVHLEPTNACNTNCIMCPRNAMTRKPKMMTWENFEKIMTLILPTDIPMISIVGFGEPTLHSKLTQMLNYIRKRRKDIILKMTTNGSLLKKEYIEELYKNGLDLIEISVVGTDKESYQNTMGGLQFEQLLDTINYLNHQKYKYLLATFPTAQDSPENLYEYWTAQGVKNIEVKGFHQRGGYLDPEQKLSNDSFGSYISRKQEDKAKSRLPADACHKLYMFLHVNVDGNFIPCVQEINNKNILFNIENITSYDDANKIMSSARPTFDICQGCEMKNQDLMDYYSQFLIKYFPERIGNILARSSLSGDWTSQIYE